MTRLASLAIVGLVIAASVTACRGDKATKSQSAKDAGPAVPEPKRLHIDRLADVVLPVQGHLLRYVALDDGGHLVLDSARRLTLRRYTPSMSQLWETEFEGGRATFLDFDVVNRELWVLVDYETDLEVDGVRIQALGNNWLNSELLLVRLDFLTGRIREIQRLSGRANVTHAELRAWGDGAYLAADYVAAEPGEPDFGRVARAQDPSGGILIARLAADGSFAWSHRIPADNRSHPSFDVSRDLVAIVCDADASFALEGRTLMFEGDARAWSASFDHEGNVLSLDALPEMREIVSAKAIDAASELHVVGGAKLLLTRRVRSTGELRTEELDCQRPYCYPIETWPVGDDFAVLVRSRGEFDVWIVSEDLEVLARQSASLPIQNGYRRRSLPDGAEFLVRHDEESTRLERWQITIR